MEKKNICNQCINLMETIGCDGDIHTFCILAGVGYGYIEKCTHFKTKPKDNKELRKQALKSTEKKGDNIIPTLCKACNCMTKTIHSRTRESYCGKCNKPKEDKEGQTVDKPTKEYSPFPIHKNF